MRIKPTFKGGIDIRIWCSYARIEALEAYFHKLPSVFVKGKISTFYEFYSFSAELGFLFKNQGFLIRCLFSDFDCLYSFPRSIAIDSCRQLMCWFSFVYKMSLSFFRILICSFHYFKKNKFKFKFTHTISFVLPCKSRSLVEKQGWSRFGRISVWTRRKLLCLGHFHRILSCFRCFSRAVAAQLMSNCFVLIGGRKA